MFHVKHSLAALLLLSSAGCAATTKDVVTGQRRGLGYTWQQQIQIGRESDPQILAQFGVYDERSIDSYVNEIGQRVLAVSHLRRPEAAAEVQQTAFTFRVVDSPVLNAFALPGGYIYVTRGLLANLENEAQLAVVLGHEIAHVARQHAARQAFTAQRAQLGPARRGHRRVRDRRHGRTGRQCARPVWWLGPPAAPAQVQPRRRIGGRPVRRRVRDARGV